MKAMRWLIGAGLVTLLFAAVGCKKKVVAPSDIEYFPADTMEKVLTPGMIALDKAVSSDGSGSLKIAVDQPTTLRLYEVTFPGVDDAKYIYKAKLKAKDFGGDVYLQMLIHFPSGGQITSTNYQNAIGGTTDWVPLETFGIVQKKQKPDAVQLNLVLNGVGTVWVDDVHLVKAPLN
jgi:hypothetical protein